MSNNFGIVPKVFKRTLKSADKFVEQLEKLGFIALKGKGNACKATVFGDARLEQKNTILVGMKMRSEPY